MLPADLRACMLFPFGNKFCIIGYNMKRKKETVVESLWPELAEQKEFTLESSSAGHMICSQIENYQFMGLGACCCWSFSLLF